MSVGGVAPGRSSASASRGRAQHQPRRRPERGQQRLRARGPHAPRRRRARRRPPGRAAAARVRRCRPGRGNAPAPPVTAVAHVAPELGVGDGRERGRGLGDRVGDRLHGRRQARPHRRGRARGQALPRGGDSGDAITPTFCHAVINRAPISRWSRDGDLVAAAATTMDVHRHAPTVSRRPPWSTAPLASTSSTCAGRCSSAAISRRPRATSRSGSPATGSTR